MSTVKYDIDEKIVAVVVDGFENEKSDNDIKGDMFKNGCDFGDINKFFLQIIADKELRMTTKDRMTKAVEFLTGYVPEGAEAHLSKISALADHLKVATTLAGASMRKWAKDAGVELPSTPKVSKVDPGFRGNIKLVADHAIANKEITFDELVKFAGENVPATTSGKDNSRGYAVQVWNAVIFAKSYNAEVVETEEVETEEEEA